MQTLQNYRYTATDQDGHTVKGSESAPSAGAAHLALLQRGLQPLSVVSTRASCNSRSLARR